MRLRPTILTALRIAWLLTVVAATMAVSCPRPGPEPGPEPTPDTKSEERKQLEAAYVEGLYLKGACALAFDDQTRYLNVRYQNAVPRQENDEVECEIHYRLDAGESTTLIVKLVVVKATDEYLWLWNEFQKVGIIVQRL